MTYDELSEDQKKVVEAFTQLNEEERDDVYWYLWDLQGGPMS